MIVFFSESTQAESPWQCGRSSLSCILPWPIICNCRTSPYFKCDRRAFWMVNWRPRWCFNSTVTGKPGESYFAHCVLIPLLYAVMYLQQRTISGFKNNEVLFVFPLVSQLHDTVAAFIYPWHLCRTIWPCLYKHYMYMYDV